MTVGITRDLDIIARVILIVLMYCGRLGSLSFALVFAQKILRRQCASRRKKSL